jgi:hypothetical protein
LTDLDRNTFVVERPRMDSKAVRDFHFEFARAIDGRKSEVAGDATNITSVRSITDAVV